jgi:hypothetical protein
VGSDDSGQLGSEASGSRLPAPGEWGARLRRPSLLYIDRAACKSLILFVFLASLGISLPDVSH